MKDTDMHGTRLYLTFMVEKELLAFNVSKIQEVLDLCAITRVPRTPAYMKGVVNVRGSVIPILDLRLKFGMNEIESTIHSRIVIIVFDHEGVQTKVGLLTDSVHDVIGISDNQIDPPPETGSGWRADYITGVAKYSDSFILLLDIQKLFHAQGCALLET